MDVVHLVESNPSSRHLFASLVWDIKDLLNRPWTVVLQHTLREGNACVDFLAKNEANQSEDIVVTEDPLEGLGLFLLADVLGVSSLRP